MATERLQKILAQAGIASRRKAEELIQLGLVTVNGATAKLGDKADLASDAIKVEGKLIHKLENLVYVAFYKPKGVISMMADPEGRPTIADYLVKVKARIFPIGRLDYNSEGLLLLTNDGDIAEKIQKSDAFPRVYHVKIKGHITGEMLERLRRGMKVANRFVKPLSVRISEEFNKKTRIEIAFLNAANLDVKTYFESKGFLLEKMTRTAFGHFTLHGLKPGQYRVIPKTKFQALLDQPELGVRDLEQREGKEREILPTDERKDFRNAREEEDAPLIAPAKPGAARKKPAFGGGAGRGRPERGERSERREGGGAKRSFGGERKGGFGGGSRSDGPRPRRFGASEGGNRSSGFGGERKGGFGGEKRGFSGGERPRGPRSDSRGPRSDSRGPRSDSRGPRREGPGGKRPFGGEKRSFGGERKGGFGGGERKGGFGGGERKGGFGGGERKSGFGDRPRGPRSDSRGPRREGSGGKRPFGGGGAKPKGRSGGRPIGFAKKKR